MTKRNSVLRIADVEGKLRQQTGRQQISQSKRGRRYFWDFRIRRADSPRVPLDFPPLIPAIYSSRAIFPRENSTRAKNLPIQRLHYSSTLHILLITQPSHLSPFTGVTCIKDGLFYALTLREVLA
jgi:hypothetical protein